jgi:hypothetical protein
MIKKEIKRNDVSPGIIEAVGKFLSGLFGL